MPPVISTLSNVLYFGLPKLFLEFLWESFVSQAMNSLYNSPRTEIDCFQEQVHLLTLKRHERGGGDYLLPRGSGNRIMIKLPGCVFNFCVAQGYYSIKFIKACLIKFTERFIILRCLACTQ